MDAIKRKINRVKKENQVYIHKVHLLCWIAHGIYLNKILSSENLMGLALSLLPSQKAYPSERLNISYLEGILQWYRKTITIIKSTIDNEKSLDKLIEKQIMNKEANDYKFLVYIFVCLLRSLGIRCRLMLSLQLEPLRPPAIELCSVSKTNTADNQNKSTVNKAQVNNTPKASLSKKASISKVISTKKVSHSNKTTKLNKVKVKKLDLEDLCLLGSADETKHNTTIIKEPSSNKINVSSTKSRTGASKTGKNIKESSNSDKINERTQKINTKQKEIEKGRKGNAKRGLNSAPIKDVSLEKPKLKDDKKIQKRQNKLKKETDSTENCKTSTKTELKHVTTKEPDKSIQFNEQQKGSRISKTDTKMEVPLRRSQRLSKSPENLDVMRSAIDQDNKSHTNSNTIPESDKSNTLTHKNETAKNKLSAFKVKMPFKLKCNATNLSDATEMSDVTATTENEMQIVVPQLDGGNDDIDSKSPKSKSKANLRKLKDISSSRCTQKDHPPRLKKTIRYKEESSDEDFQRSDASSSKIDSLKKRGRNCTDKVLRKIHSKSSNIVERELVSISSSREKSRHFPNTVGSKLDVRNDIINLLTKNISEEKQLQRSRLVKHKLMSKSYSDSDSDYVPQSARKVPTENDFKEKSVTVKRRIPMKKDLIEIEKNKQAKKEEERKKKGINVWIEVFAEAEEKWISVDVVKGQVHCIKEIYVSIFYTDLSYYVDVNSCIE